MTFHVGQKVVCVYDKPLDGHDERNRPGGEYTPNWPVAGVVYTIRSIDCWGFRLEEIRNPTRQFKDGYGEARWKPRRFRPIVARKTDISIFQRMLLPQGVDA